MSIVPIRPRARYDLDYSLDERAQERLRSLVQYRRRQLRVTLKALVRESGYDPKTLHHHLVGRTRFTPRAIEAMVRFLCHAQHVVGEFPALGPDHLLYRLRHSPPYYFESYADRANQPWIPRERDAIDLLRRIDRAETNAINSITYGTIPPAWLLPKKMMRRLIDDMVSNAPSDYQANYRAGLTRFERGRFDLLFAHARKDAFRRCFVTRYKDFIEFLVREPPYDYFTEADIHSFLQTTVSLISQRKLSFRIAEFCNWDNSTEFELRHTPEITFIEERFYFSYNGLTWDWNENIGNSIWPEQVRRRREEVLELLRGVPYPDTPEENRRSILYVARQILGYVADGKTSRGSSTG